MNKLLNYLNEKLWLMKSRDLPWWKRIPLNTLRVIVLTSRRFVQNQCTLKASALTFYTLFSIVPILALIFGIAKGLGLAQVLDAKIHDLTADYPAVAEKIIKFSDTMLDKAKGGVVAGIGVILLIWSAIKLMSSIEANMNEIWGIRQGRNLIRQVTDYAAILIICPLLLLTAGSGVVVAAAKMDALLNTIPGGNFLMPIVRMGNGIFPMLITWLVFAFIYITIPNTKVKLKGALIAGLVTAVAYTMLQSFYVFAQFTTSKLNAIYGSFAALPLFLTWLNLSWILILAGAQLTFAIQNVCEYEMQPVDSELSQVQRHVYALEITTMMIRNFQNCGNPLSDDEISQKLELPIRMVRSLLFDLVQTKILMQIVPDTGKRTSRIYQVAMPPEKITAHYQVLALNELGGSKYMNEQALYCRETYRKVEALLDRMPANLPLADSGFLPEDKKG